MQRQYGDVTAPAAEEAPLVPGSMPVLPALTPMTATAYFALAVTAGVAVWAITRWLEKRAKGRKP